MAPLRNKVLILFAHPSPRRSQVVVPMARVAEWVPGVTLVDLYADYPNLDIDVDAEQARLREHGTLIFLHPMYWYSTPAMLKEWQDLVLEHGFAYGEGGGALAGKTFFSACTTGAGGDAFGPGGYNNFTVRQLLVPLEQMAALCGMRYLPPFVLHGSRTARARGVVEAHLEVWEDLLEALVHDRLDLELAQQADRLDPARRRLIAEG
ncbi:flavodoxin family protein [Rhodobacteraceae bacterium 2CG4]|uniref:Flavodoxin family protein n=1 Tax=Halovulum marinum TaxID=2662447 RepID=A0A6L5YWS7_9RHOB|nr:NAD(P)H-dependent oxidoreductase [Halovulum marinum]MSU88315.1 flavodoxin family protein [Halovulum marinum]